MKILRTIRFDQSDEHVFARAALPDEWAVSGLFGFFHLTPDTLSGKDKQAFANGFLGLESHGRSTFVTIGEVDEAERAGQAEKLADNLMTLYGAPDKEAALSVAHAEIAFAEELASGNPVNTLLAVSRHFDDEGQVREAFRTIPAPTGKIHTRIWDVVEDQEHA